MPYTSRTVLTDNGIQFTDNRPANEEAEAAAAEWATQDGPRLYRLHACDWACEPAKIEHRLTKPRCLSANGQTERTNLTIAEATVKRGHHVGHDALRQHLLPFVEAYDDGRLRTLRGLTPYDVICQAWPKRPERSGLDPSHHMPEPNA